MAIKKAKYSGAELKVNREKAEFKVGYGAPQKALVGGKLTSLVLTEALDSLLVGDLDAAKDRLLALRAREYANFYTFHPDGE